MGKIPGGDRAFIDSAKIAGYVFDPDHRVGRHKARVFATALDLRQADSGDLVEALLTAARIQDAEIEATDQHGVRYMIAFRMSRSGRTATIRSSWIVRTGEDFPRFVTAMVAKQEAGDE